MSAFTDYIKAVRGEMTHVAWPSRGQAIAFTGLVIGICLVVSVVLGGFDFIFTFALERFIFFTH